MRPPFTAAVATPACRKTEARVKVVVVIPEGLHDAGRTHQPSVRPDVHELGACPNEEIDEPLREAVVDLPDGGRRPFPTVEPRVVDVDVEAVLVGRVLGPEVAAVPPAEVADPDPGRVRMLRGVRCDDLEHLANKAVRSPTPPGPVRPPVQERVPREVGRPGAGQLDSAHESAVAGSAESERVAPVDLLGLRRGDPPSLRGERAQENAREQYKRRQG